MLRMLKKGLCVLLCVFMMCGLMAGCVGAGSTASNKIIFYVYGSMEQVDMYTKLVNEFI